MLNNNDILKLLLKHVESAEERYHDGSPSMMVRHHLIEAKRLANDLLNRLTPDVR